jgi:hypothetical protein
MRTLLALARAATLAWLALVGFGAASLGADEEAESPWLTGGSFERAGSVHSGSTAFHVWRRTDAEASAAADATLLTLLREDDGALREAYDVARAGEQVEGQDELFTIRRRAYAEEEQGSRIAESRGGLGDGGLELGRDIVTRLLAVEARWHTGARLLEEAARVQQDSEDPSARARLRDATRALERAHQVAPWHLGIVCDLLAAYQLLLPYEVGTDRGANSPSSGARPAARGSRGRPPRRNAPSDCSASCAASSPRAATRSRPSCSRTRCSRSARRSSRCAARWSASAKARTRPRSA